jgi:phytanoyl-CoA hydroxylase
VTQTADIVSDLSTAELETLARDGFLVRENVFNAAETAQIAADCEELTSHVLSVAHGKKWAVGSYMFERSSQLSLYVKWEPDAPEVLQGIEPFVHLSPALETWAKDARLTEPCRHICAQNDVVLYTEKLNLKRARQGGQYILHQDYPYWQDENPVAANVATAMLFLDDATIENGCLEAAPGSHREGVRPMREVEGFGALEMDTEQFDMSRLRPIEAKAGSVVFFGAFLVHRSLPNRSALDRRALLFSYQPAGHPHVLEVARAEEARRKAAKQGA